MSEVRTRKFVSGGVSIIEPPTFTESLLMEILLQCIDARTSDSYIKKILARAGFTAEEIAERTS